MIDVRVFTDEEHARKWERDENMARVHLSKHERDRQLVRWANSEVSRQSAAKPPQRGVGQGVGGGRPKGGNREAARQAGVDEKMMRRAKQAVAAEERPPERHAAPAPVPERPKVQRPQGVPDAPDYVG